MTEARRRAAIAGGAVLFFAVGAALVGCGQDSHSAGAQDTAKVTTATSMMGFDLNRTVHSFQDTENGGIQQVVANSADDAKDIAAIRAHLSKIAGQFAVGDFSDPAAMHGANMPGLAAMRSGAPKMQISYAELPAGGQITFRSADPAQVEAIHTYFAAQRADHSMPGMGMGH
ncbi:MAG TPA: hypothetical protein VHU88_17115 [Sporichthyaceae bacterium]|jgi:hypothetical protein|nr:hypothetical protein [Sporichthyaceae bacterium]